MLSFLSAVTPSEGFAAGGGYAAARRARHQNPRRYVSAQAYYHWMRARLAELEGQPRRAVEELQLARVYDHEAAVLILELSRLCLDLGRVAKARKLLGEARKRHSHHTDYLLLSARLAERDGHPKAAARALRRAIRRAPADPRASLALAELLRKRGRPQSAIRILEASAARSTDDKRPLMKLAELLQDLRRFDAAVTALERAVARFPRDETVALEAVRAYRRVAKLQEARSVLEGLRARTQISAPVLLTASRTALWTMREAEADRLAERFLAESSDPLAPLRLGLMYAGEGRYGRAKRTLLALGEKERASDAARYGLASSYLHTGDDRRALAEYARISAESPYYVRARRESARALLFLGQASRAEILLRDALKSRDGAELVRDLAGLLARDDRLEEALALLDAFGAANLGAARSLAERTALELLHGAGRGSDAQKRFEKRWAAKTLEPIDALLYLYGVGRIKEAARLQKTARLGRPPSKLLIAKSEALLGREKPSREARRAAETALALEPSAAAHSALGWAHFLARRPAKAKSHLASARRLDPRNWRILERLGDVIAARGNPKEARGVYQAAASIARRVADDREAVQRLRKKSKD